jgi:hypothetical protein
LPVSALFFVGHGSRGHRVAISVRKLDYDAKQVPPRIRLAKDVVNRIVSFGFRALNERMTKARFLEFFGCYGVPRDVINAVFRPDDLLDPYPQNCTTSQIPCQSADSRGTLGVRGGTAPGRPTLDRPLCRRGVARTLQPPFPGNAKFSRVRALPLRLEVSSEFPISFTVQ